jgi:Lar family restriction alleviation protein
MGDRRDEPKPCPFCGGAARSYFNGTYWAVLCNKCEGEGPPSDHEGGAIAYWNSRAADGEETVLIAPEGSRAAGVAEVHSETFCKKAPDAS